MNSEYHSHTYVWVFSQVLVKHDYDYEIAWCVISMLRNDIIRHPFLLSRFTLNRYPFLIKITYQEDEDLTLCFSQDIRHHSLSIPCIDLSCLIKTGFKARVALRRLFSPPSLDIFLDVIMFSSKTSFTLTLIVDHSLALDHVFLLQIQETSFSSFNERKSTLSTYNLVFTVTTNS